MKVQASTLFSSNLEKERFNRTRWNTEVSLAVWIKQYETNKTLLCWRRCKWVRLEFIRVGGPEHVWIIPEEWEKKLYVYL